MFSYLFSETHYGRVKERERFSINETKNQLKSGKVSNIDLIAKWLNFSITRWILFHEWRDDRNVLCFIKLDMFCYLGPIQNSTKQKQNAYIVVLVRYKRSFSSSQKTHDTYSDEESNRDILTAQRKWIDFRILIFFFILLIFHFRSMWWIHSKSHTMICRNNVFIVHCTLWRRINSVAFMEFN